MTNGTLQDLRHNKQSIDRAKRLHPIFKPSDDVVCSPLLCFCI